MVFGSFACARIIIILIFPTADEGSPSTMQRGLSGGAVTSPLWTAALLWPVRWKGVKYTINVVTLTCSCAMFSSSSWRHVPSCIKHVQYVVVAHVSSFPSRKSGLFHLQSSCLSVFRLPLAFCCAPLPVCSSSQSRCFFTYSSWSRQTQAAVPTMGA